MVTTKCELPIICHGWWYYLMIGKDLNSHRIGAITATRAIRHWNNIMWLCWPNGGVLRLS